MAIDPAISSARRRLRDALRNESKRIETNQRDMAWRHLYSRMNSNKVTEQPVANAVAYATTSLATAVAHSMNVRAPINVVVGGATVATTDFKSVTITVARTAYDDKEIDQVARFVSFIKGLIYHEIGHVKFSTPYPVLLQMARDEGWTTDTSHLSTRQLHHAWNILEDQRMETAMVRTSNTMRHYFTVIVLDFVTANNPAAAWPFVAGRTYLPEDVRRYYRSLAKATVQGDTTLVHDTSECVARYKRATCASDMAQAAFDFVDIMGRWAAEGVQSLPDFDLHKQYVDADQELYDDFRQRVTVSYDPTAEAEEEEDDEQAQPSPSQPQQGDDQQDGDGAGAGDDEDESNGTSSQPAADGPDKDSQSTDESLTDPGNTQPASGVSRGNPDKDDSAPQAPSVDEVQKAIDDAMKQSTVSPEEAKDFMATVNTERNRTVGHNTVVSTMNAQQSAEAEEVHRGMMNALEQLIDNTDPTWQFGKEDGVLDPVSYAMADPGDTNYWTSMDDSGARGYDLAVSLLIDTSYSMGENSVGVGIAALGIRKACDALEIPCTVMTFDDGPKVLWDATEEATDVIALPNGGTEPYGCLEELDNHVHGRNRHLVLILTDGLWPDNVKSLSPWQAPGRHIILIGLGYGLRDGLSKLNPDAVVTIYNPLQLAEQATHALSTLIA